MVTLTDSMALSQRPYEAFHPPLRPCLVYRAGMPKGLFQPTSVHTKVRLADSLGPIRGYTGRSMSPPTHPLLLRARELLKHKTQPLLSGQNSQNRPRAYVLIEELSGK